MVPWPRASSILLSEDQGRRGASSLVDLALPALLVRVRDAPWSELVRVQVPSEPLVAFSTRDLRSPGIGAAVDIARAAGFQAAVRSPGGRMVAYDAGAVVVDHIVRAPGHTGTTHRLFMANAAHHARFLGELGAIDVRVGAVENEYCPGEFSLNVGGVAKVVGSAQRVTAAGALFSTVVQVSMTERVASVIADVSHALGYPLRRSSITGLDEHGVRLTAEEVARALREDYAEHYQLTTAGLPAGVWRHASMITLEEPDPGRRRPVGIDEWCRAHPLQAEPFR